MSATVGLEVHVVGCRARACLLALARQVQYCFPGLGTAQEALGVLAQC